MDMGLIMNTMRDPAGVPAHPVLFQGLMIFTWIFHIAFVHLTLGAAGLAIVAFLRVGKGPYWERLSMAMTKVAKVGVSLLIVLGVAPLLFTQVIYDPQWYASNVLSARWAIGFIFTLIVAYCLWFAFYWGNHEGAKRHIGWYAVLALALFCLDGLIMHVLAYQALLPEQWMGWYAPGGVVDTRGATLHALQWPRFLFIMSLSLPAVGLYLLAYADYFSRRADREPAYRAFARTLGRKLALRSLPVSAVLLTRPTDDSRRMVVICYADGHIGTVSGKAQWDEARRLAALPKAQAEGIAPEDWTTVPELQIHSASAP